MLRLYLQAPFGVFRTFTAGSFRPTAGFLTPSAAYGLLLNLAGIEMREEAGREMTLIKKTGLPIFRLALAALVFPSEQTIFQQLHNYPVGDSGKEHAPATKGSKYNITPVRRSFLSNIRAYICVDAASALEDEISNGLAGKSPRQYGLPFLGDNNFLLDKLNHVEQFEPAYWFVPVEPEDKGGLRSHVTRLTILIDRQDMSRTQSSLFAPMAERYTDIPDKAWVEVGY